MTTRYNYTILYILYTMYLARLLRYRASHI